MHEVILVLYLLISIALIAIIMIQQGKGAEMGASFGAGASNTVFGASGSGNFLTRLTTILAVTFFLLSLLLGNYATKQNNELKGDLILDAVEQVEQLPETINDDIVLPPEGNE